MDEQLIRRLKNTTSGVGEYGVATDGTFHKNEKLTQDDVAEIIEILTRYAKVKAFVDECKTQDDAVLNQDIRNDIEMLKQHIKMREAYRLCLANRLLGLFTDDESISWMEMEPNPEMDCPGAIYRCPNCYSELFIPYGDSIKNHIKCEECGTYLVYKEKE